MGVLQGIRYNLRGLRLGLRTPALLALGLIRLAVVLAITAAAVWFALRYAEDVLTVVFARPTSPWLTWLWHLALWVVTVVLVGTSTIVAYLAAQVLFSIVIMDAMSRVTEKMLTGQVRAPVHSSVLSRFGHLVTQELPRAVIPVLLAVLITILGWTTPLAPVTTALFSAATAIFLAWDSTDLTPARRMESFRQRLGFLKSRWTFHLGFGLLFLIPVANIVFLAFAPVGGTLYYIETQNERQRAGKLR
jgi:CysZ protein